MRPILVAMLLVSATASLGLEGRFAVAQNLPADDQPQGPTGPL